MLKQFKNAVSLVVLLVTMTASAWDTTPASVPVQKESSVSGKVQGRLSEVIQNLRSGQGANSAEAIKYLQHVAVRGTRRPGLKLCSGWEELIAMGLLEQTRILK